MASAPGLPYKRYDKHYKTSTMSGKQRQFNPMHESLRFDAYGHMFYETPAPVNVKERMQLVKKAEREHQQRRADVLKKPATANPRVPRTEPENPTVKPPPEPENLSLLERRQERLKQYIDGYNAEHFFPHIYTGYGPPSSISVTAFGPQKYNRKQNSAYRTTSQEAYSWDKADIDTYAERGAFTKKGEFTSYLRASLMKQVNLKKTAH